MCRRAFVRLVMSFAALLPFGSILAAADGPRISGPIVHDNLAIYLVHGAPATGATPRTLQDALAEGLVKVRETGSVNELTVENVGDDEVFIQAGDIVKGGQQDRVLSVDLLLPPHSGILPIAAFCVEPGRWSARGHEDAKQFSSAAAAMPSHEAKLAMRAYAVAAGAPRSTADRSDPGSQSREHANTGERQQEIWADVAQTQNSLARSVGAPVAAPASPSSLQLSLENEKLKQAQAAYTAALQGAGESDVDIVGYVFAVNGKINSADVYASNALFRTMWPKLLAANVTEAIGEKDTGGAAPPTVNDIERFLAAAGTAPASVRTLNGNVQLATRDGASALYTETRRTDGSWVHQNYLAK
jgi:hypothetical protein